MAGGLERISSVYDYSQRKHLSIAGELDRTTVSLFDYVRRCHFSGDLPSLFDYGRRAHITLEMNGLDFTGFDYGDRHHFSGHVDGNSVNVYDYGLRKHFSYSVS